MSSALRSVVLRLAIAVVALHGGAIAIYYAADIPLRPASVRYSFFLVWMVLTLVVVLPALHRIRAARGRRR
jgi:hypothetical protein